VGDSLHLGVEKNLRTGEMGENGQYFTKESKILLGQDRRLGLMMWQRYFMAAMA